MSKASDLLGKSGAGNPGRPLTGALKLNPAEHSESKINSNHVTKPAKGSKELGGGAKTDGGKAPIGRRPKV